MNDTHIAPSVDFKKWRTLILYRESALIQPKKPPGLLRSKLIALNSGASEMTERQMLSSYYSGTFLTFHIPQRSEMETKSDLFACREHICNMWWVFCMFDFYLSVLASGPAFLPCAESSLFLNF